MVRWLLAKSILMVFVLTQNSSSVSMFSLYRSQTLRSSVSLVSLWVSRLLVVFLLLHAVTSMPVNIFAYQPTAMPVSDRELGVIAAFVLAFVLITLFLKGNVTVFMMFSGQRFLKCTKLRKTGKYLYLILHL